MADNRINFIYPRKDDLQKAVDELKKQGHRSVTMTTILEALLDRYLDETHPKAMKAENYSEVLQMIESN